MMTHTGRGGVAEDTVDVQGRTVLWVDDELETEDPLVRLLGLEGFAIEVARSGADAQARIDTRRFDAVILDLHLPDIFGLTLLERLRARGIAAPALVVTAYYLEPEMEARAKQAGATAFAHKPFVDSTALAALLESTLAASAPLVLDAEALPIVESAYGIVTASPEMQRIVDWIARLGPSDAPVLLTGETGTGKELVARALHRASRRADAPFVALNCAAIPDTLVETELFGHRKGAFTGAVGDTDGVFGSAHRGTLFLDEIGDLPMPVQASLLRCLDSGEIRRVGETRTRTVDVRVVAATNRPLRQAIVDGTFRADLYYRIAMVHAELPPLRERPDDIDALIAYWLPSASDRWSTRVTGVTRGALDALRAYEWPGNVRELFNVLQRAVAVARGELLSESDVAEALYGGGAAPAPPTTSSSPEARQLLGVLDEHRWNHTKAARALGINRTTLWRRLARLGMGRRPDPR